MSRPWAAVACASSLLVACDPSGDLTLLLQPGHTIEEVPDGGSTNDATVDGWTVSYMKFVVAVGDVRLEQSAGGRTEEDSSYHVVDMHMLSSEGTTFTTFAEIRAARWDKLGYEVKFGDGAVQDSTTTTTDFDQMQMNGWTFLIEGTLANPTGRSCPPGGQCVAATDLTFRVATKLDVRFSDCRTSDGLPGVKVPLGGTSVGITLHGDHLWFTSFPSGAEMVDQRAQWMVDCDVNHDNMITPEEMMSVDASTLFPANDYMLAGAPIPIHTAWDFARAQLATTGHLQGDGRCAWSVEP